MLSVAGVVAVVAIAGCLLFARLGHYALWDDEAMVALAAQAVARTGDTGAVIDHNLVAYRGGILLRDLHDRSTPPLAAYLAAPFVGKAGTEPWRARLPFALCGLGAVALIVWWTRAQPWLARTLIAIGLVANVPLLLFSRQCRYYAPALLLSLAVVHAYLSWRGGWKRLAWMGVLSVALFAANSMACVVLYVCLTVDYLVWRRAEQPLDWHAALALVVPLVLGCGALAFVWNPFSTQLGEYVRQSSATDRLTLMYWSWRDLNRGELLVLPLIVAALLAGMRNRDRWLVRGTVALALYVSVTALLSPQTVFNTSGADVRYLVAVIPLGVLLAVGAIVALTGRRPWLALLVGVVAFGTNALHGGMFMPWRMRSTIAAFVGELIAPPGDPYTVTARWVNEHVAPGASVWVLPDHMVYPLMFHAPHAVYAWQLAADTRDPQFAGLSAVHFQGRVPPDYLIVFGPTVQEIHPLLEAWRDQGLRYEPAATLDTYWRDMHRPELFWRTFVPITHYDRNTEAIYVFRHLPNAVS